MGGWVVKATPRSLYPREKDAVHIVQESGWAPGPLRKGAENLAPTGIRFPDRPASSHSLWRLSYPDPPYMQYTIPITSSFDLPRILWGVQFMKLLMMELSPVSHSPPTSHSQNTVNCLFPTEWHTKFHTLSMPQRHTGEEAELHSFLTSTPDGCVRSFTLRPLYPHTYCIGGWVDSRDGLGVLEEKISGS